MAILGSLIKKGIELSSTFQKDDENIVHSQRDQLKSLLHQAKDTAFGKYYGFAELLEQDDPRQDFANRVPIFDYHQLHEQWWIQQQKYPDITWPGKPNFFANSSGTTGKKSKRIPITEDMLKAMRSVGVDLIQNLKAFNLSESVFESEVFVLSSSADLTKHDHGFVEGEISGINVHNFPGWYDIFYRPGKEIAMIDQWDDRLEKIVQQAPAWNIGSMAGIPSWILVILKAIVKEYELETIHDLWPNLEVYSTGGVAFEPYRDNFEAITRKPLTIIDTYLASEGFFGYSFSPDVMHMKLATAHQMYYEFIPFDDRGFDALGNLLETPEVHQWEALEEDQDYALLITTCAGAWRYMIGDTLKFHDIQSATFSISGRTKFFLNVVGSQLSEEKINAAIQELSAAMDAPIDEFSVSALKNEESEHYHQWVLASENNLNEAKARENLDQILQDLNKNYKVARTKALKDIQVRAISKSTFYAWLENAKKKGGQVKTPKVMNPEDMKGFLKFIDEQS